MNYVDVNIRRSLTCHEKLILLGDSATEGILAAIQVEITDEYIFERPKFLIFNFEAELMKLGTTDLETATIISLENSEKLVNQSIQLFGSELTHIFVVFLSILIDDTVFENLSTSVVHKKIEIPEDSKITLKQKSNEKKIGVDANFGPFYPFDPRNPKKAKLMGDLNLIPKNPFASKQYHSLSLPRIRTGKSLSESFSKSSVMSNNLFNGHHEHSNEPKSNILSQDNEFTNIRRSTGSCIHLRTRVDYQQILRSKAGFALVCHRHVGESEINKAWKKKWISFKGIHLQFCKNQDSPVQWRIPLHLIKEIWTGGRKSSFNILALETEFLFQVEEQEVSNWFFAFQTQIAAYMEDLIKSNIEEETNFLLDIKWWRVKENALVSSLGSTSSPFSSTKKILPPMTQTELYSWVYNDQLLSAAVHSSQNTRKTMEDRHVIVPSINEKFSLSNEHGKNYSFFGVFDGHGGVDAAHFIKDNLLTNIFSQSSFFSDLNDAIIKGVSLTDSDFLDFAQAENITCGSTACFGFLGNGKLTIANIGDSRAVISKSKTATPLSDDHKPNRFDEMDRIIKAGGTVDCCQEMNVARLYELNPLLVNEVEIPNRLAQLVGFNEVYRIQKEMSVSRSIGDRDFKYPYCKDIWEETECSGDLVISIPEIVTYNLDGSDEFLIIACDVLGLWDVFNNQAAVDFVHMKLKQFPDQYLKVSTLLAEEAIKLGSQDNISVLVLFFGSKKDIEIEEIETHKIPNQLKLSGIRKKKSNLQGNSSETIQPLSPHLLHPHSSPQSLTPSYTPTPNSLSKSTPAKKGDKIVDMPRSGSLPGVTQLPIINDKNSNNNNNNNNSNNNNNNNNNNNDDQLSNISTSCEITNSSTTNETTMSQEKNSTIEPTPTNTSNSHSTPSPAKSRSLRDTRKKLSSSHDPRNNNNNNNNNDDNNNSDMK